ncbi:MULTISPECIES: MFS transporter [unclassified Lysobacter]|uniref:MFS transporter n=1 Tax=unclassified Lysobacter TaxID=2635362 RepID=UPI001BE884B4|nr:MULTISPECIES: MFS transporter [unclassified Lysobacter]MBT2747096.1 MFS transporter [Lysobacter sp. ISL-42]MBT2750443.1 MFS transporter [Lysobacter sp. ISL-50]MBT2776289.1 MFS transporter [Lysobacter sp. ISL-54]MBT2780784.1 MFS transporter [Lysobacter sp. ISL-52]
MSVTATALPGPKPVSYWPLLLAATAMLMITMGIRQSQGLLIKPIGHSTGLGIAEISFALAIGQFVWGAVQPVFGALADQRGPGRVLVFGGVLLMAGMGLTPFVSSQWGLMVTLGILGAAGAGAGSFSILIGATAQSLPAEKRSMAAGMINAGGSLGQFLFAPLVQAVIAAAGWMAAMWTLAAAALATLPLAWPLRRRVSATPTGAAVAAAPPGIGLREQLRIAVREPSYWMLHLGFFTCGFHIAFLVTHLPSEIALCGLSDNVSAMALALIGLFNIGGSLAAGWLGQRYRMKHLLALMYASRAALIGIYLMSPPTPLTFYLFAAGLGVTWLATVPPTAGLVGKLFGPRYLGTLFGFTLLSHQIGGFFGAWLGGLAMANFGDYTWMWYADIALALLAAAANLPIREARVPRAALAPA